MSKSEYARLRGWSPAYVSKLNRNGRLVLTPGGLVDVAASNDKVARTGEPTRGGRRTRERTEAARMAHDAIVIIPASLATRFAVETRPETIRSMLHDEFRAVIEQVADRLLLRSAEAARPGPARATADEQATRLAELGNAVAREWPMLAAAFDRDGAAAVAEAFGGLVARVFHRDNDIPGAEADAPGDAFPRHDDEERS